jgi:hypothetical protein
MQPVKLAIVGIDHVTDLILASLNRTDRITLCAICETQPALLNKYRESKTNVLFFDDPREMILRTKPDVVLYWRECAGDNFIESMIDENFWLIVRPPLSGGLELALNRIKRAEKQKTGLFVWTPWMFIPGYETIQDWLGDGQIRGFISRSVSSIQQMELPSHDALLPASVYGHLFLAQRWMGLPQKIYCRQILGSGSSSDNLFQYVAVLNLIYEQSLASFNVAVNAGPDEEEIIVIGNSGQIRSGLIESHLFDCDGNTISNSHRYEVTEARLIAYTRQFEAIWQLFLEKRRSSDFDLNKHLGVIAILEVSSIASRTGHAEQLAKIVF